MSIEYYITAVYYSMIHISIQLFKIHKKSSSKNSKRINKYLFKNTKSKLRMACKKLGTKDDNVDTQFDNCRILLFPPVIKSNWD